MTGRALRQASAFKARAGKKASLQKLDKKERLAIFCAVCSIVVAGLGVVAHYDSAQNQLEQTRRDQAGKQLAEASAQLSKDRDLGLRVDAVQTLGLLMKQSPAHRSMIVDRLSRFIRENATARLRTDASGAWIESSPDVVRAVQVLAARPEGPHDAQFTIDGARLSLPSEHLEGARLAGADLDGAILAKARLGRADLSGARLTYANLRKADLQHARLRGANLAHAHLTGANLSRADLRGADLATAVLSSEDLRCAQVDGSTKLPPGVARPDTVGCP